MRFLVNIEHEKKEGESILEATVRFKEMLAKLGLHGYILEASTDTFRWNLGEEPFGQKHFAPE